MKDHPPAAKRWRTAVAMAVAGGLLAGACGSSHPHQSSATTTPPGSEVTSTPGSAANGTRHHIWIFSKAALDAVISDPTAAARLRQDEIYEILRGSQRPTSGYDIVPTLSFTSYSALQQAVSEGVPSYVKAVLYDNEAWTQTPAVEQGNPAAYYQQAAALAHAHGLKLVATPALDLTSVVAHVSGAAAPGAFIEKRLAAGAGQSADVEDIQAQRLVPELASFSGFIGEAAAQARSANPRITLVAGLSTCAGGDPSAAQLLAAAEASLPYVSGWWMNVPGSSTSSPSCGSPRAQVAASFIDSLPGY